MAVKKATAKKSVAKKAAVKKSAAKKTTAKKAAVKKRPAKKSVVKRAAPKKAAPKKVAVKKAAVKKSAAKKTAAKKAGVKKRPAKKSAVKKSAVKKSAVKKSAVKKSAARKSAVERIVIPEAPITTRTSRVEIISTPPPAPVIVPAPVQTHAAAKKQGASGRVVFAVALGVIILGLIVWSQANNSKNGDGVKPLPSASATETPSATPSASDTPSALVAHEAPQGVVAQYTSTGATIFWKAPTAIEGLTGYNVEISVSNGPWKLISTVPSTQLSLDVKKGSTTGWTSFKVSSVYSDSVTTPAKAFGLPGTYS